MKTPCKLSLAMLAVALIFGTALLPSTAFSGGASVGSLNHPGFALPHGTIGVSSTASSSAPSTGSLGNPNVVPPISNLEGKSYAEWSVAWWQRTLSNPFYQGPGDLTGQYFPLHQSGPVWFLQGTVGSVERSCTMPSDTYLVCPLILYENDYPCPDTTFHPPYGQSLEDWLTAGAKAVIDGLTPPSLEVDGVALKNLTSYRATSKLFTFTGDLSMQANFDACITGSPQVAVSDGYLVILKPLSPGTHTLHFSGFGEVIVHLTVTE